MPKIEKRQNFFRDNLPYLMGGSYLLIGVLSYIFGASFNYLMYSIFGVVAIIFGFLTKNSRKEYIKWNKQEITIKDQINGKLVYQWEKVDDIIFSKDHLTIKSGAANGTILELREYQEKDKTYLKNNLQPSANIVARS